MLNGLIYIVMIFMVIRFCVTLFNFLSNPKLGYYGKHFTDKISILIPARNEAENIIPLLQSIYNQDYKNYEVLILDDNSTDDTYSIVKEFCENHPHFQLLKGEELPPNWLGKNFACHQLAQQATGHYFLFIDADEKIHNHLINNSLYRMKLHHLSLLSLFTWQKMDTLAEKSTVPLMHYLLLNLLPLQLVRLSKLSTFSAASGQFMLFDAHQYRQYQWHQTVANKVVEDIEICKNIKNQGLPTESLLAHKQIECRMYASYNEAIHGFSKNILAGFGNQILGLFCYILLVVIGPIFLGFALPSAFWILPLALIILSRLMISYLANQNPIYNILLHPFQFMNLLIISILSIYKHFKKNNYWKGRKIG